MRWRPLIILALICVIAPQFATAANSSSLQKQIEDTKKERDALIQEQQKLQEELGAINAQGQTIGSAIKALDTTKKKLSTDISITQSKINSTDLTIKSLENSLGDKEQQIIDHRQAIADALFKLSEYEAKPLILSVLASVRLADIWRDSGELSNLNDKLTDEINALRDTKQALVQEKTAKEKVKQEQLSLKGQLASQKSVVEENQKAKEDLLAETKSKEAEYQKLLDENLQRQKEFENDLFQMESELNLSIDPTLVPSPRHGLLSWPFDNSYMDFCASSKNKKELGNIKCVTQPFTFNPNATNKGHNGVDFRAAVGTPVHAISAGVIQGTGNSDEQRGCYSYGRWILIKHNNGLSSIYAHLSSTLVKPGQAIGEGEIIGYSGGAFRAFGSGNSSAPHLHLGLFASQGVEIRPFTSERYLTTGSGCHNVMLPVADLKAYLDPLAYLPSL